MKEQIYNTPSYHQAVNMAKFADITLSSDQINSYVDLRQRMPTGQEQPEDPAPWTLCDQQLLNSILDPVQSEKFERKYPNIFKSDEICC